MAGGSKDAVGRSPQRVDGNGLELYWDRPEDQWPRGADGRPEMFTHKLDLDDLLKA